MWHRPVPYFYYSNSGYLLPFVSPIHVPKTTQNFESPRISPGIAFLQQPQRFEFDEKGKDLTNLSELEVDPNEVLQTLYNEARSLPRFQGKEKQNQVKIKAPEVPTVEDKQIKNEEILKVIDEYNTFKLHKKKQKIYENLVSDPTLAAMLYSIPTPTIEDSFFPPSCKNITELLNGKNRIFINNQQYNGKLNNNNREFFSKTNGYGKNYYDNDIFGRDKDFSYQEDLMRSSRSDSIEKPFWNTMDRPGSPIRKLVTTRFQMPRKNIQTNFLEAEYLNTISPSFIYFREIHHSTKDYEITKPTKLKDLSVNTRMSIGSHGYGVTLPVPGDCILWRYCLAPYRPDHLVRARIIDRKPMIRACEDKDPNNEYYKVFYIDYGTTNWVKKRVCYEMPSEEWFTKPPEALPISLYNIMPKSSLFDDQNTKLEWPQNVCLALRHILEEFKYFEIHIKNYLLIKKKSEQTYAGDIICYLQNPKTHPEFAGTGQNLSQLLANKCIDDIIIINGINPDTDIPRYETQCRFDRNTFNLPDYLSHKSMRLQRDQGPIIPGDSKLGADSVSLLQHNSLDPYLLVSSSNTTKGITSNGDKKNNRVPLIDIDPELWPRKGLPWKVETLEEEGFLVDNYIYISYCCRNITPDCFNFSSHIIKHNRIKNIIDGKESYSKYQLDILEAKKHLDNILLSFYSIPENRRIFSWDYVKNKLKENEVVNCIVGMLENSDDDRYRCHRARILGVIENFANDLKGIKNNSEEEEHIKFVIVELYDYGGVMSVSVDSICQIHPLHENISPFTLRCSLHLDSTKIKNRKFKEVIKISPKWYRDIKKDSAKIVCSSIPSKAKVIQFPSNDNTYTFDYFINPCIDSLCYKITDVQETYLTRQDPNI
ncbi:Tudor domain-containing protein [Strongyloides ratti]|uniref:Tudor domain-containing protein n=1 Tax=Strongyloides ratti TaxID=34506 RepID=A0A090LAL9_STRRB|nr:Tudor domain-containing protein [Strongyloides ratti]CEF66792.1 Tudor domain-containing protein [Strongyloides ratti]